MNRFIKNIIQTLVLITFSYLCLLFFLRFIENEYNKNVSKPKVAMIGHSHIEFALNDSLVTEKLGVEFANFGRGGQSLFWSIISAKKHKVQGVKNFIILVSNNSYTTGWKTFDKDRGERETYLKNFLEKEDFFYLIKNDFNFGIKTLFKVQLPTRYIPGQFKKGNKPFTDKIIAANQNLNPDFTDEILHEFIKSNDSFNFVIVRLPLHKDSFKKIYNETLFLEKLNNFKKYSNVLVLDYGHLFDNEEAKLDSLFMDFGHLHFRGSNVVSEALSDTLLKTKHFNLNFKP